MLLALTLVMALAMAQASPAFAAFGFLTTWGSSGTTNGNFQAAFGVATDASGNVYVADCQVNRVQKVRRRWPIHDAMGHDGERGQPV
jgi:hypothetical protein